MGYIFFIHPSVDGHLGCFHVLATAMNIGVHVPFLDHVFLWIYAQKWRCSIFSFLRNLHTIPHSGYTNW